MADRRIRIEIVVDSDGAVKKLKEFDAATDGVEKKGKATTGAIDGLSSTVLRFASAAVVGQAIRQTALYADDLERLQKQTRINTEELQKFSYAAGQNGNDLRQITQVIGTLADRLASGDQSARKGVAALGLEFDKLRAMRPEEAFKVIGKELANVGDTMKQIQIAKDLGGPQGFGVLPTWTSDLNALGNEAERFNQVISDDGVKAAAQFQSAWTIAANAVRTELGYVLAGANPFTYVNAFKDATGQNYTEGMNKPPAGPNNVGAGPKSVGPDQALADMDAKFGTLKQQLEQVRLKEFQEVMDEFHKTGMRTLESVQASTLHVAQNFDSAFKSQVDVMEEGLKRIDQILAAGSARIDQMTGQTVQASGLSGELDKLDAQLASKIQSIETDWKNEVANLRSVDPTLSDSAIGNLLNRGKYDQAINQAYSEHGLAKNQLFQNPPSSALGTATTPGAGGSSMTGGGGMGRGGGGSFGGGGSMPTSPSFQQAWNEYNMLFGGNRAIGGAIGGGPTPDFFSWAMHNGFNVGAFGEGGVVDRPTFAMLGERGEREFVIPESKMPGGVTIVVNAQGAHFENDAALERLADKMAQKVAYRLGQGARG